MSTYTTIFGEQINFEDLSLKEIKFLANNWDDPDTLVNNVFGEEYMSIARDRHMIVNNVNDYRLVVADKVKKHFFTESDFLKASGVAPQSWIRFSKLEGHLNMEGLLKVLSVLKLKLSLVSIDSDSDTLVKYNKNDEFFQNIKSYI